MPIEIRAELTLPTSLESSTQLWSGLSHFHESFLPWEGLAEHFPHNLLDFFMVWFGLVWFFLSSFFNSVGQC